MKVSVNLAALREIHWHQYALRFALGGLVTALTGLIAKDFGPVVGGLFLAFPAIFPATATLLARRERDKKQRKGLDGRRRACAAVSLDAIGTRLGAVGLMSFAAIAWRGLPKHHLPPVLVAAAVSWLIVSVTLWWALGQHGFIRSRR